MYLFYVDESGVAQGWNDQDNFILAGVAVHEGQVRKLSEELDTVQQQFFPSIQIPIELHAGPIYHGKGRFRSISVEQRATLLDAVFSVIAQAGFPNLIAFVTAIHVSAVQTSSQAFGDCLEDICERFNVFLVRQFNAGYKDKGMLIMDRSGREQQVRDLMTDFEYHGTRHGYLGNIVDVPYFADSSHTRMLQLADLLAFAGHRYFNHNDDTYLMKILSRIDRRSRQGSLVGLRHIVASAHHCSCIALH